VLIVGGALGLIVYVAVVPIGYLIRGTFWNGRGLTLEFFRSAYSAIGLSTMVVNSLLFAVGSTVVAVGLGTVLAYLVVRTDLRGRKIVFALALVPLIMPGILHTIAWIFLASPRIGLFNRWLEVLPGTPTFDVFSLPGMMLVEGLHLTPLVLLLMAAAFRSMDPSLEEAAATSGASVPTIIRRITVPLVRPALLAAILIMMVRALEAFEVPALLGIPSGIWVFTSRIWRVLNSFPVDYGQAGAYSMSLVFITMIGLAIYYLMLKRSKRFQTLSGKGYRPQLISLGKWRPAAVTFVTAYIVIASLMPLLILVYASTQPFYSVPSLASISNATFGNYVDVASHGPTLRALRNSLFLGVAAATIVMFVTAVAAWVIARTKTPGRWVVDGLASAPLVIPGLVVGVALLFVYLRSPLPIFGTIWILLIAYLTRYMPYGMRYSTASMYQIGIELEESAQMSGATWWQSFRRVMLPLLVPGLLAGWLYIFLVSFRELSSSILLYTPGNEVLSVIIFSRWEAGQLPQLAALGVLLVLGMTGLVFLAQRLGSQFGLGE
jgi:iron(III) transport system permease protein